MEKIDPDSVSPWRVESGARRRDDIRNGDGETAGTAGRRKQMLLRFWPFAQGTSGREMTKGGSERYERGGAGVSSRPLVPALLFQIQE
jgi:hypothetical protein